MLYKQLFKTHFRISEFKLSIEILKWLLTAKISFKYFVNYELSKK